MSETTSDITIEILKDIRSEMRAMRAALAGTNARLDEINASLNARLDETNARLGETNARMERGFSELREELRGTNRRIDNALVIVGGHHHGDLEGRVRRIEDHLNLPR